MKQQKELCFIIQGNYGQGWEDVDGFACGIRQVNYIQACKNACASLKTYNINEKYPHRIIKRYENM